MASYNEAVSMRDTVSDYLSSHFRMRPRAVGVMPLGDHGYAIKVTLPRMPTVDLPGKVSGIPVRYDLQSEPAVLAADTPMSWYEKALNRRR